MADEADFLRAALADPGDYSLLFVYADWLEEQGDEASVDRALFLRLTARLRALPQDKAPEARLRLRDLAARLDPEWLAVVSRLDVENCGEKRRPLAAWLPYFDFVCDRSWERMQPTDDPTVRLCTSCGENVYYCDTVVTARRHAREGHCVAVDLGIIRRKNDLAPALPTPGFPSEGWLEQEALRLSVDEVSAERERRKSEQLPASPQDEPGDPAVPTT